jgi:hypothetical protein
VALALRHMSVAQQVPNTFHLYTQTPNIYSSQPLAGLSGSRCREDERVLELMRGCCSDQQAGLAHSHTTQLCVFDCRPCVHPQPSYTAKLSHISCSARNSNILHRYINAAANTAMGKGTEGESYSNCRQTHPQPPPAAA